jgi:hypothetical protein
METQPLKKKTAVALKIGVDRIRSLAKKGRLRVGASEGIGKGKELGDTGDARVLKGVKN